MNNVHQGGDFELNSCLHRQPVKTLQLQAFLIVGALVVGSVCNVHILILSHRCIAVVSSFIQFVESLENLTRGKASSLTSLSFLIISSTSTRQFSHFKVKLFYGWLPHVCMVAFSDGVQHTFYLPIFACSLPMRAVPLVDYLCYLRIFLFSFYENLYSPRMVVYNKKNKNVCHLLVFL